jgi:hypothetical protein
VRDRLRNGVRQTAGADVVDQQDGIRFTHGPALIDDFLRAPLNLRVAALDRSEIQVFRARAAADGRRRATAETDQHRRAAEHDDFRAGRNDRLFHVHAPHVADTARDHDGLVITTQRRARRRLCFHLERAEVAENVRPAKFVVERGCAERPFDHDVERRSDARWLAEVLLPRLFEAGNAQV